MIYIYCLPKSEGAAALTKQINLIGGEAKRLRKADQVLLNVKKEDLVVAWGGHKRVGEKGRWLNAGAGISKLSQLQKLSKGGVKVPEVALQAPTEEGWLGRTANHHEGLDLLNPVSTPAFWVKKLPITMEYRIHVFKRGETYVSVRAGAKIPRIDNPHEWIRSWTGGWKLSYGNPAHPISEGAREAGKLAAKVLGLDFGAVDVGAVLGGGWVVFESNSRPGLEGGTLKKYAEEFLKLSKGGNGE